MHLFTAVALAVALSLDSLAVGTLYGLRGIRLSGLALLIASVGSAVVLGVAMATGAALGRYLPSALVGQAGATVLIGVGLWVSLRAWRPVRQPAAGAHRSVAAAVESSGVNLITGRPPARPGPAEAVRIFTWRVPFLRLVVQVLSEPGAADLDRSGSISAGEAALLGTALASDSLGAGLGAGLAGFSAPLLAPLVGLMGWLGLVLGMEMAARLPWRITGRWGMLHGLALVAIGVYRMF